MKRRTSVLALMALIAAALFSYGCDQPLPEAPTQVNVNVNQTVNLGAPLPNATPTPGATPAPGAADKTITGLTVTEVGGDGARTFPVGGVHMITATPRNSNGDDPCVPFPTLTACGAYTEQDIRFIAGSGVTTDCASTTAVVCDLGPGGTNYNRQFRTLRVGSFTYSAQFRTLEPVSFTGTVLATGATSESYRAGGSGPGFGPDEVGP